MPDAPMSLRSKIHACQSEGCCAALSGGKEKEEEEKAVLFGKRALFVLRKCCVDES